MKNIRIDVYVGTKSRRSLDSVEEVSSVEKALEEFFSTHEMPYSLTEQIGGYLHRDGRYVVENSLRISMILPSTGHFPRGIIRELKERLCQESALVCICTVRTKYRKKEASA